MRKFVDDRTEQQKQTHTYLVYATDKFMSGWGCASNGLSKCAWAIDPNEASPNKLLMWVKSRSEMKHVNTRRIAKGKTWKPQNFAHFHIYVCDKDHPSQR